MILSDPHTHTHPGYLGRENIIGIVLKDQVFSRFYEHDAPGYVPRCVHTYDPRFQTKSLFSVRNLSGTQALFIPRGMLWLTCVCFLQLRP